MVHVHARLSLVPFFLFIIILFIILHSLFSYSKATWLCHVLLCKVLFSYSRAIITTVEDACCANNDFFGARIFDIKLYVEVYLKKPLYMVCSARNVHPFISWRIIKTSFPHIP